MGEAVFGRTNRVVPPVWLKFLEPSQPDSIPQICKAAAQLKTVIDVTYQPALFGRFCSADTELLCELPATIQIADSEQKAFDLATGALIQILSAIGRSKLEFLSVNLDLPLEDFQLEGLLKATSLFLDEGSISFLGFSARKAGRACLNNWRLHDAFSFGFISQNLDTSLRNEIAALAENRRVGLITDCDELWRQGFDVPSHLVQTCVKLCAIRNSDDVIALSRAFDSVSLKIPCQTQ